MLSWQWGKLSELSSKELYEVLALRQRVFVLEQKCLYLDADGKDREAWHLLGWSKEPVRELHAYLRILGPGVRYPEHSIGRVLTAPECRGKGAGKLLMLEGIRRLTGETGPVAIRIAAQAYLEAFYEGLGFHTVGAPFDEDGIPHLEMLRAE